MKKQAKKALRGFLRSYKPFDRKLRQFGPYRALSTYGHSIYSRVLQAPNVVERAYLDAYLNLPINSNVILFESFWGQRIACNPKAMFDAYVRADQHRKNRYIWVCNDPALVPPEVAKMPNVSFVKFQSPEYARAVATAGFLINNMPFPPYVIRREGQELYSPYHGIPVKCMGRDINDTLLSIANTQRNFLQSSKLFSAGPYHSEKLFGPYGVTPLVSDRIFETGMPRIDTTLNADASNVRRLLGVPEGKRLVFFAPTWRGKRGALEQGAIEQASLCRDLSKNLPDDCFLIVSIHQLVRSKLPAEHGIPMLPSNLDTNEVLAAVDVLITDYSSILFDYLPLDRPTILYVPDLIEYQAERGLYFDLPELPVTITFEFSDLISAIGNNVTASTDPVKYNKALKKFLPHEDGRSAERSISQTSLTNSITNKRRILFSVGALLNNGITTSLLNLLSAIDYDHFDVFVVIDAKTTDADPVKVERYHRIDPRCTVILRCGKLIATREEQAAYQAVQDIDTAPTAEQEKLARNLFRREARRIFGDAEFDVAVDFGGYTPFWTLLIAGVQAKRRVIYQHNNLWEEAYNPDEKRNQKQLRSVFRMYKWFDAVVSVSEEIAAVNSSKLSEYYVDSLLVSHVRNALNSEYISTRAAVPMEHVSAIASLVLSQTNTVKFITASRLSPEKNQARLIDAFAIVLKQLPNAFLIIAGDGPLKRDLEALTVRLGIQDRVLFTGMVANPYPLIKAADCLVMSSNYEGQPMVILEAASLGTPCIGTNVPGVRSTIQSVGGSIAEPTPSDLADLMINFATSGCAQVKFDASAYLKTVMDEFYDRVCNGDKARRD